MYDGQQRLMNGGNNAIPPPMMHMQNNSQPPPHPGSGMFPFGLDHVDQPTQQQQQHGVPKLDQQWDPHLLMDDNKHLVN